MVVGLVTGSVHCAADMTSFLFSVLPLFCCFENKCTPTIITNTIIFDTTLTITNTITNIILWQKRQQVVWAE